METRVSGTVSCEGLGSPRSVHRFVEKRIAQWLEDGVAGSPDFKAHFQVTFQRQGQGHVVYCTLRVILGERSWMGARHGNGPHEALIHTLNRMSEELHPQQAKWPNYLLSFQRFLQPVEKEGPKIRLVTRLVPKPA